MVALMAIDSSAIESINYSGGNLTITFQDGRVHTYFRVPAAVVEELERAGSAGAYFNAYIRNQYSQRRES